MYTFFYVEINYFQSVISSISMIRIIINNRPYSIPIQIRPIPIALLLLLLLLFDLLYYLLLLIICTCTYTEDYEHMKILIHIEQKSLTLVEFPYPSHNWPEHNRQKHNSLFLLKQNAKLVIHKH